MQMLSKKLVADNVKLVDELITYTDEKVQEPKKQSELKELLGNIKKFLLDKRADSKRKCRNRTIRAVCATFQYGFL